MATVADLLVRIEANTQQMRNELRKGEGIVNGFDKRVNRAALSSSSALDRVGKSAKATIAILGGLGVGLGIAEIATGIAQVNAQFQDLQTSLKVATGSAEAADAAFANLRVFAKETPFQLSEVTQAFISLKNLGLDPSMEALRAYGDIASSFNGKSLDDFIQAVADASTGEFERLKEFGIKASSEGDKVAFTFRGLTTTIGKNAREIEGYLQDLARNNFGGAMSEKMDNLSGRFSNLKDQIDDLYVTIGESGGIDVMAAALDLASASVEGLTNNLDNVATVIALVGAAAGSKFLGPMIAGLGQAAIAQAAYTTQVLRGTAVTIDSTKADVLRTAAEKASAVAALDRAKSELQKSIVLKENVKWTEANAVAMKQAAVLEKQAQLAADGRTAALLRAEAAAKSGTAAGFARAAVLKQIAELEGRAAVATAAHSAALARSSIAAKAATFSMRALSGAMAFLGGPVGAAITVLAGGVYLLSNAQTDAQKSADDHKEAIERLNVALGDSNGLSEDAATKLREETKERISAAQATLEQLKAQLALTKEQVAASSNGILGGAVGAQSRVIVIEAETRQAEAQIAELQDKLDKLDGTKPVAKTGTGSGDARDKEAEKIQKVIDNLDFERAQLTRTSRERAVYNAMQQAGISSSHEMATAIKSAALAYYDAAEAVETLKEKTDAEDKARAAIADSIADLERENRLLQVHGIEREKLRAILEAEATAREGGIALSEKERAQIEGLTEANARLAQAEEEAAEAARDAREFARDFGNVIASSFEDAILSGEKFGDILKSLEQDIARIILRMAVTKPLENAIGGAFGSFDFGSMFGSMFGGAAASGPGISFPAGSTFANGGIMTSKGKLPLRQYSGGGIANTPQLAMFGEGSVPEAYVPVPSGKIPVELNGGAGGFTYAPVFDIDARNSTLSSAEIRQIVKAAVDQSVVEVRSLQRRKGNARI